MVDKLGALVNYQLQAVLEFHPHVVARAKLAIGGLRFCIVVQKLLPGHSHYQNSYFWARPTKTSYPQTN